MMKTFLSFLLLSPLILVHSPACADSPSGGGGSAIPASVNLELDLRGYVKPRCELNLSTNDIYTVLTDGPGQETVPFNVNCNQRLSVSMQSRNGGLQHEKHGIWDTSTGFTGFLPYKLEFTVNADGAEPVVEESEKIKAVPGGGSIGTIPFRAKGNLKLSWVPEGNLFGGRYGDVIEIRVSGEGETGHPRL